MNPRYQLMYLQYQTECLEKAISMVNDMIIVSYNIGDKDGSDKECLNVVFGWDVVFDLILEAVKQVIKDQRKPY